MTVLQDKANSQLAREASRTTTQSDYERAVRGSEISAKQAKEAQDQTNWDALRPRIYAVLGAINTELSSVLQGSNKYSLTVLGNAYFPGLLSIRAVVNSANSKLSGLTLHISPEPNGVMAFRASNNKDDVNILDVFGSMSSYRSYDFATLMAGSGIEDVIREYIGRIIDSY